jgi:hypothetical protein
LLKFEDETPADGTTSIFKIDEIDAHFYYGVPISIDHIRGSGELHVTEHFVTLLDYLQDIWEYLTVTIWAKLLDIEVNTIAINNTANKISNDTDVIIEKLEDLETGNITVHVDLNSTVAILLNETYELIQHVEDYGGITSNVFIGASEYEPGDPGKVFVQLIVDNQYVLDASVWLWVLYPDNSGYFIEQANMPLVDATMGTYAYDFEVPSMMGIYPVSVQADLNTSATTLYPSSDTVVNGSVKSGSLSDVQVEDNVYYQVEEVKPGSYYLYEQEFLFNVSGAPLSNDTEIILNFEGKWKKGSQAAEDEEIYIEIYNWSSGSYDERLTNEIPTTTSDIDVTGTFENVVSKGFVNNSQVKIRFKDSLQNDTKSHDMYIDYLAIGIQGVATAPIDLGGAEVHVYNHSGNVIEQMLNQVFNINDTNIVNNINQLNQTFQTVTELKFIDGAEYVMGDAGKQVVQFFEGSNPLDNHQIEIKILYPNMTTFVDWTNMTFLEDGIYYYDFTVPYTLDVYTSSAKGYKNGSTYYASHTFHVSRRMSAILAKG